MVIVYRYVVFFFQAEDGIRYLVRSRGLGDVYKRQVWIAVGNKDKVVSKCFQFYKDRMVNIESSAVAALDMLRRFIKAEYS